MFELILAILLALATPANTSDILHSSSTEVTTDDPPPPNEFCPYGVENCVCTYPGFTGGENGHVPLPPQ